MTALRLTILACGLVASLWIGTRVEERGADFNHFYAAAKLSGTGQLYDWSRIQEVERPNATTPLHYGRLPFYAFTIKWMSDLPYHDARAIWFLLSALALLVFAAGWPVERRADLIAMLCWSCPAGMLLAIGQDDALFLFCWTIGLLLLRSERGFTAGLVLSLCAAKPHLALAIPVFLIARRKWATLAGGLVGGIVQLAVSFALEGRGWPANLLRAVTSEDFSPAPGKMPNLHGLTSWLPYGAIAECLAAILVLAAVWVISRRSTLAAGAAAAILGGLLVGHHAYVYDCVLMLPALALARTSGTPRLLDRWALALATPLPYALLMQPRTAFIGQIVVTGFSMVLLGWLAAHSLGWRVSRTMGWLTAHSAGPFTNPVGPARRHAG